MKTKLTLLIIIILTSYSMHSQICGTPSTGGVSYSTETATNTSFLNSSNSIYINVYFHIVRNNHSLQLQEIYQIIYQVAYKHHTQLKQNINKKYKL